MVIVLDHGRVRTKSCPTTAPMHVHVVLWRGELIAVSLTFRYGFAEHLSHNSSEQGFEHAGHIRHAAFWLGIRLLKGETVSTPCTECADMMQYRAHHLSWLID